MHLHLRVHKDILDCIMLTLKRNSQYHRICARHSKEVLDLLYGVDKKIT